MKVGNKLTLANVLMAISALVVAIVLSRALVFVDTEFKALNERTLLVTSLLEKIRFSGLRIVASTNEYLLLASMKVRNEGADSGDLATSLQRERALVATGQQNMNALIESYRGLVQSYFPGEIEYLERIEAGRAELVEKSNFLLQSDFEAAVHAQLGAHREDFEDIESSFLLAVNQALEDEAEEYREKVEAIDDSINEVNNFIWAGLGGVAIVVIVIGVSLGNSITRPLERLLKGIARIRQGDYRKRLRTVGKDELAELARSFNEMASRLDENEQLRQEFIEQLEQKNAELERFTYTVSHDLKSPLVTVKGFLGMLEKDLRRGEEQAIARDIEYLKEATDTMGLLLDDLLELSRIGRVTSPPILFSMNELCEDVVKTLSGPIQQRQARITIAPGMPSVYADRDRIRDVLQNLLENAIKFSAEEEPSSVRISAETRDDTTLFLVEDNGIGIEPEYHDKVFALFERLDAKTSGTGIGLALVKRIIETHGGTIWIESPLESRGTRFCFTLPEVPRDAVDDEPIAVNQN